MPAHASVPRWPSEPPGIDPTGRVYGVVAIDCQSSDDNVVSTWLAALALSDKPMWTLTGPAAAAVHEPLAQRLTASVVGLRLLIVGPEQDVLALQATARGAGMIDAELTLHVTATDHRRVYCAHCRTTSSVCGQVGDVRPCSGCGRALMIFAHCSRHTGTYLGFLAGAEELP